MKIFITDHLFTISSDLKAEVELLRQQLIESGGVLPDGISGSGSVGGAGGTVARISKDVVVNQLKEELNQREKLIAELNKSWEEKLKEASDIQQERKTALQDMGVAIKVLIEFFFPLLTLLRQLALSLISLI